MIMLRARCAAVTLLRRRPVTVSTKQSSAAISPKDVLAALSKLEKGGGAEVSSEIWEQAQQALDNLPLPESPQKKLASWEEKLVPLAAGIVQNEGLSVEMRLSAAQALLSLHIRKDAAVECTRSCIQENDAPTPPSPRDNSAGESLSCLTRPVVGNENMEPGSSSGLSKRTGSRKKFPGRQETSVHTTTEESVSGAGSADDAAAEPKGAAGAEQPQQVNEKFLGRQETSVNTTTTQESPPDASCGDDDSREPTAATSCDPQRASLDPSLETMLLPSHTNQNSWGRFADVRGNVLRVGLESSVEWVQPPNELVDGVPMVDVAFTCQQVDALEYQGLISGYDMVQIMDQIISATIDPVRCPGVLPKVVAMTKALSDPSLERQLAMQLKKEFVLREPQKKQGLLKTFVQEFVK